MPEYKLGPGFVHSRIELEATALGGLVDGPSGKNFGHLGDILLRVAAVDAQGMEFEQLASVIFVQTIAALGRIWSRVGAPVGPGMGRNSQSLRRVRPHAQPVVQVKQQCRALRRSHQQVFELAERVRANYIALVAREHQAVESLVQEYIEVIEPEICHYLFKLALAVDGPQKFRLR